MRGRGLWWRERDGAWLFEILSSCIICVFKQLKELSIKTEHTLLLTKEHTLLFVTSQMSKPAIKYTAKLSLLSLSGFYLYPNPYRHGGAVCICISNNYKINLLTLILFVVT